MHAAFPTHHPSFDHPNSIWWNVQVITKCMQQFILKWELLHSSLKWR
jgi:hypothetical protein